MFAKKEPPKYQSLIEDELENAVRVLKGHPTGSEEYVKTLNHVERLHALLPKEKESLSKNTMANVGANLLGIWMIIKHEHVNVITSKALGFVARLRF